MTLDSLYIVMYFSRAIDGNKKNQIIASVVWQQWQYCNNSTVRFGIAVAAKVCSIFFYKYLFNFLFVLDAFKIDRSNFQEQQGFL